MLRRAPSEILLGMIKGYHDTQVVYVAAKLGIADHLKDGPKGVEELTLAIAADDEMLVRFLRIMVVYGLLVHDEDGRFRLTEVGECLRTDSANSMHEQVMFMNSESMYQAWGKLLHTVQSGEDAFRHAIGMGFFEYCTHNAEFGALFNRLEGRRTRKVADAVLAAYDFSSATQVVDVGGGNGTLIAEILQKYPHLTGVLFDMESVIVVDAERYLRTRGLSERCELISGSFFDPLPRSRGTYILKSILHDWNDERCARILKNCHQAMADKSKLLIIERVIPERVTQPTSVVDSDLAMMVMLAGQERTEKEFRRLLDSTGFQLDRVIVTGSDRYILECVPV